MPTLRLAQVVKTYDGAAGLTALEDVDLTIEQGDFLAIVGPSGAGKTTLLSILALLDSPTSGTYQIDGIETANRSERWRARIRSRLFSFVFQSFHLLEARSVGQNVELGLVYRGLRRSQRRRLVADALGLVGLADRSRQKAATLSGGERQRVAIARAIATGAPILVADEPTGNLDTANSTAVMDCLSDLNARGITVIVVTHDSTVAAHATRQVHILDGIVTEDDRSTASPTDVVVSLAPSPGRDSRVRALDMVRDAMLGLRGKPSRTIALIFSVLLGVGLAVATTGIAQTARFQVSDVFDARANQRVALSAPGFTTTTWADLATRDALVSRTALDRVAALAGVQAVIGEVEHGQVPISSGVGGAEISAPLLGFIDPALSLDLVAIETGGMAFGPLGDRDVLVGSALASTLHLGPLAASPTIWIMGIPMRVAGILTDAGLRADFLTAVAMSEAAAAGFAEPRYATVEIRTTSGAAPQVASQAPLAWLPTQPELISVNAPPDPTSLRQEVESNVATMLATLTAVALLVGIVSLGNSMVSAVYQRIAEFGLRRAIGARPKHVVGLVLGEALMTGLLGGLGGVYSGMLGVLAVTMAQGWRPVLWFPLIPLGIAGGVIVGLLGGIFATIRAARIEPAEALRA